MFDKAMLNLDQVQMAMSTMFAKANEEPESAFSDQLSAVSPRGNSPQPPIASGKRGI